MKKALVWILCLCTAILTACAGEPSRGASVPNKKKPIIWFNNQPANSLSGELDMDALSFNDKTWYVGNNAGQGAELQGQMILDYLGSHGDGLDRNGDGIIGYVLLIGDIGHNDSIARTRGVRKALGTAVPDSVQGLTEIVDVDDIYSLPIGINLDGESSKTVDGSITIDGQDYILRELASQEMKSISGSTWDAATAANIFDTWSTTFGDLIDVVVSNNDSMGMAVFNSWARKTHVPVFGYDANPDCVAAIQDGFAGTISQNADIQAYMILQLIRNGLDDADPMTGIAFPDAAGNVVPEGMFVFKSEERSFYANSSIVNAETCGDFLDSKRPNPCFTHRLNRGDEVPNRIWIDFPNNNDFYYNGTFACQFENYDDILNLELRIVRGDGLTESSIVDRLVNPQDFEAFGLLMIKKDNASAYLSRFR